MVGGRRRGRGLADHDRDGGARGPGGEVGRHPGLRGRGHRLRQRRQHLADDPGVRPGRSRWHPHRGPGGAQEGGRPGRYPDRLGRGGGRPAAGGGGRQERTRPRLRHRGAHRRLRRRGRQPGGGDPAREPVPQRGRRRRHLLRGAAVVGRGPAGAEGDRRPGVRHYEPARRPPPLAGRAERDGPEDQHRAVHPPRHPGGVEPAAQGQAERRAGPDRRLPGAALPEAGTGGLRRLGDAFISPNYEDVRRWEEKYLPADKQRDYENTVHD